MTQPRNIVFFTDFCLGLEELPRLLRDAGLHVVTHSEFGISHDEQDIIWIPKVAAAGHVILTKDKNIRRDSLEVQVVLRERAYYFTLGRAHRKAAENAATIVDHRATIEWLVRANEPPLIAQINVGEIMRRDRDRTLKAVKRRRR